MSHLDALFGGTDEFGNENDGEILSDDEVQHDNNEENADPDNPDAATGDGQGKAVKVEPKKRTTRNPRNMLNIARLCGPRGIVDMESYFKGIKFHDKGHEKDDLDAILKRMQHWAHRMYPKYGLDDSLATIENLGRKKQMQAYMNKYRMGLLEPDIVPVDEEKEDEGLAYDSNVLNHPLDPLDSMLEEQIAISRASNLNTSGVANLSMSDQHFDSLREDSMRTPVPKTPVHTPREESPSLSDEVRAKIAANRLKAMEIRKAKMAAANAAVATAPTETENADESNE